MLPPAAPIPAPEKVSVPAPATRVSSREAARFDQLGREHAGKENFQEALAMMNRAITLNPGYARAYNARGYVYLRMFNYPKAIADFSEAIRLDPVYANAYHNRSVARKLIGEKDGAAQDDRSAKKLAASVSLTASR